MIEQIESIVIAFFVGAILTYISTRWSTLFKRMGAVECGVRALLRDRMLQMYLHYKETKKPIPMREVETFEDMNKAYVGLDGNSFMPDVHREFIHEMPHEAR